MCDGASGACCLSGYAGHDSHVPDTNTSSQKQMLQVFVESGGRLLVCIPCMEERNLKATDLIEQAVPTSGSALTEEILSAKATLTY